MPRGDRRGPDGRGPETGRRAGYCAGYDVPGYMNDGLPRGGPGMRRGPVWGRGRRHRGGGGRGRGPSDPITIPVIREGDERALLEERVGWLETELEAVRERLGELGPTG